MSNGDNEEKDKKDVVVIFNGKDVSIPKGKYTIPALRDVLHVSANEVLAEMIDGAFQDLTSGDVHVKEGDVFASHKPSGGASSNVR